MTLRLCHDCYHWIVPRDARCPDCAQVVDAATPDPPVENVRRHIGEPVRRIGEVRFQRRMLPETGTLYETENGLYFVPHVVKRRQEVVEKTLAGRSLFWIIASVAFPPLVFIVPFIRSKKTQAEVVSVYRPANVHLDDGRRLAEILVKNPGAFFVSQQSIRHINRKGGRWVIDRFHGRRMRFSAIVNPQIVERRMAELAGLATWSDEGDV